MDGQAGLAPANNTTTSAWMMDDQNSYDGISLKGIRGRRIGAEPAAGVAAGDGILDML